MKVDTVSEVKVIDNFLPEDEFNAIRDVLMGDSFPWFFSHIVAYNSDAVSKDFYFAHTFYRQYCPTTEYYTMLYPLFVKLQPNSLMRCKANLYPNMGQFVVNDYHSDYPFPHKACIYSINTNNGYTGFKDGLKVKSVANRILLFDASVPHHSTHCTDEKIRVNINMNYF